MIQSLSLDSVQLIMIKQIIGKSIKKTLNYFGKDVISNGVFPYKNKSIDAITVVEKLFKEFLHDDFISENPKRNELLADLMGVDTMEGLYICYYLNKSLKIEGDLCEFGVAQGRTTTLMANEIMDTNKKMFLFDSFEGLPAPTEEDELIDDIFELGSMNAYTGKMSCPRVLVESQLLRLGFPEERIEIIPGMFNDSLKNANHLPKKVSFAFVDFDFYLPIIQALEFLHPRMSQGANIVIDDYKFFSSGVEKAVKEFQDKYENQYELIIPKLPAKNFAMLVRK